MPKEQLVKCPNYNVCQSMVLESKVGNEHRYGIWDSKEQRMVYVTCNGG